MVCGGTGGIYKGFYKVPRASLGQEGARAGGEELPDRTPRFSPTRGFQFLVLAACPAPGPRPCSPAAGREVSQFPFLPPKSSPKSGGPGPAGDAWEVPARSAWHPWSLSLTAEGPHPGPQICPRKAEVMIRGHHRKMGTPG